MYELSIAQSILDLGRPHVPGGASLQRVHVRAGALQALDQDALRLAWRAVTLETPFAASDLALELLPWRLTCLDCGHQWEHEDLDAPCRCGGCFNLPDGSDELLLTSLEVTGPERPPETAREPKGAS